MSKKKVKKLEVDRQHIIGIDLGTSFSEVARITESGVVQTIPNSDGDLKTPSIVSWASGRPIVGKAASPDLVFAPEFVIRCGKRSMGKTTNDGKPIPIGTDPAGNEITAVDFSASILGYLKKGAEDYLGYRIECAVITVPAYFDTTARNDTIAAAKIAGFREIMLLNEPEAAAIFDGLEKAMNQIVVVVDTGGGTTDVTAIEIDGNNVRTLFTDGDRELGGLNYTEAGFGLMCNEANAKNIVIAAEKDLATFYQNLDRAREAKEMLSRREEVTVIAEADGKRIPVVLTRQRLREAGKSYDDRFVNCCLRLHEGLKSQNKKPDRVLLVGGNSRQPHIAELVKQVFGIEPSRDTDADFVVVKGAGIRAQVCFGEAGKDIVIGGHRYLAEDIKLQTVAAHPICVAAKKDKSDPEEYNCVIVPANTPLPHDFEERFSPMNPGQREVLVKIVQGKPGELSKHASLLREIRVPIKPSDKDQDRIRLKGRYTEEGLLELTVVDELLGKPVSDSFVHKAGLSEAEIDDKRKRLTEETGQ